MKKVIKKEIQSTVRDRRARAVLFALLSVGWNLIYGIFNLILGIRYHSGWFYTMFAYYALLGAMRFFAVAFGEKRRKTAFRAVGGGLILLAVILSAVVMLTIAHSVSKKYNTAVMITIATFTFFIVIKAIVNAVKAGRQRDETGILLRNISCAAAVGSILSLERSMLGTFGESTARFTYTMEGVSGLAGFLIVVALGISMLAHRVSPDR